MSASAFSVVVVCLSAIYQGSHLVGGALRQCPSGRIYCEPTDSCVPFFNCPKAAHCTGFELYSCDNGAKCYSYTERCDGIYRCNDKADELYCTITPSPCTSCDGGTRCYSTHDRCDGLRVCADGADEVDCSSCSFGEYECKGTGCYRSSDRCDRTNDCADGSDEYNCAYSDTGLSTGSIIGIAIGTVIVAFILAACKVVYRKSTRRNPRTNAAAAYVTPQITSNHLAVNTSQPSTFQSTRNYDSGHPPTVENAAYHHTLTAGYGVDGDTPATYSPAPYATEHSLTEPPGPSLYHPSPLPAVIAAPPPSYDSLYGDNK